MELNALSDVAALALSEAPATPTLVPVALDADDIELAAAGTAGKEGGATGTCPASVNWRRKRMISSSY